MNPREENTPMVNIEMKIEDITIKVDLSKTAGPSASGKSVIIASTKGNQPLPEPYSDVKVGLNVYKVR
jgi:hypothetical protein